MENVPRRLRCAGAQTLVADQAELARVGHVSRARMTQIMNLLNLVPDIQEAILYLPRVGRGCDPMTERELRAIAGVLDWGVQQQNWWDR